MSTIRVELRNVSSEEADSRRLKAQRRDFECAAPRAELIAFSAARCELQFRALAELIQAFAGDEIDNQVKRYAEACSCEQEPVGQQAKPRSRQVATQAGRAPIGLRGTAAAGFATAI